MLETIKESEVKRLDHLGIVAGIIEEFKIKDIIDNRLGNSSGEKISAGEAVAGMIINGLGFTNRVLSLTPQFFENRPIELLFGKNVNSEDFNHYKLGRTLEKIYNYDGEFLFSEIALSMSQQEGISNKFNSLDTTSFSVYGEYKNQHDDAEVQIKLGYSKDHRPDLKQIVSELMVTQDGGIPLIAKCFSGNSSDNKIFEERSKQLLEQFQNAQEIRYLIADSKLYTESNSENLKKIYFITRIPNSIGLVENTIDKALKSPDKWEILDDGRMMQAFEVEHYGINQKWYVLSSDISKKRAEKQVDKKVEKETKNIEKQIYHLQVKRFYCAEDAKVKAQELANKWTFHQLTDYKIVEHKKYAGKGRPKRNQQPSETKYQIKVEYKQNEEAIKQLKEKDSFYIIGSNASELGDQEVINAYKNQHQVENKFRFLKDPMFFAPAFFVKKVERMIGLIMVMLLAMLVYSIAERRLRKNLQTLNETVPNQINQEVQNPTLRWIFQLLEGINYVKISIENNCYTFFDGLTALRKKILQFFGNYVTSIYQISSA